MDKRILAVLIFGWLYCFSLHAFGTESAKLETTAFKAVFTMDSGAVEKLILKDPRYQEAPTNWDTGLSDEDDASLSSVDLVTTNVASFPHNAPLRFEFHHGHGFATNVCDGEYELDHASPRKVTFSCTPQNASIKVVKKFEIDESNYPYQFWLTIRVENTGKTPIRFQGGVSQHGYQHESKTAGGFFSRPENPLQGICRHAEQTETFVWNRDDLDNPFIGYTDVSFVAVQTNFFINAMIPSQNTGVSCRLSKILDNKRRYPTHKTQPWGHVKSELLFAHVSIPQGESKVFRVRNYMGPKIFRSLRGIGYGLETSVDFGWLGFICQLLLRLLQWFESFSGNWGLAIVLLTVTVKITLLPLTLKSLKVAEKTKALRPELDVINAQHKDDPQAKQEAISALYKAHEVNPLGGCIPMLIQMPIWVALFTTLRTSPELYRAPFLGWLTDLSSPDPYFITPVLIGVTMFVNQRFVPVGINTPHQKLMLYGMPMVIAVMMLFWPSGLALYSLVNALLSLGQQLLVHKLVGEM